MGTYIFCGSLVAYALLLLWAIWADDAPLEDPMTNNHTARVFTSASAVIVCCALLGLGLMIKDAVS